MTIFHLVDERLYVHIHTKNIRLVKLRHKLHKLSFLVQYPSCEGGVVGDETMKSNKAFNYSFYLLRFLCRIMAQQSDR